MHIGRLILVVRRMKVVINKKNLIEYVEDSEYILIDMMHNRFYTLDYIGSLIWERLSEGESFENIVNYLSTESGMPYDTIQQDVIELLDTMKDKEFINIEY